LLTSSLCRLSAPQVNVIDATMSQITGALAENATVLTSYHATTDAILSQYTVESAMVDAELERIPRSFEEMVKMRKRRKEERLERELEGGVNHSLNFHMKEAGPESVMELGDMVDPFDFEEDKDVMGDVENTNPHGDEMSLGSGVKLTKAEKEEKVAWDVYDKFLSRETMFASMATYRETEREIERMLEEEGLTQRERKELERRLERTRAQYCKSVLVAVKEYKPKVTARKWSSEMDNKVLRDLGHLGVGQSSLVDMMSASVANLAMGESVTEGGDEYEDDAEFELGNDGLMGYDMQDPNAWSKSKKARGGSPGGSPGGGADEALQELKNLTEGALRQSEEVSRH